MANSRYAEMTEQEQQKILSLVRGYGAAVMESTKRYGESPRANAKELACLKKLLTHLGIRLTPGEVNEHMVG